MVNKLDRFGLPINIPENETAEQTLRRRAKVQFDAEIVAAQLFGRLKYHLGLRDAQKHFARFAEQKREPYRPKGSIDKNQQLMLLNAYNVYVAQGHTSLKHISQMIFDSDYGQGLGNSASAIKQRLSKLIKDRERDERERLAESHNLPTQPE